MPHAGVAVMTQNSEPIRPVVFPKPKIEGVSLSDLGSVLIAAAHDVVYS